MHGDGHLFLLGLLLRTRPVNAVTSSSSTTHVDGYDTGLVNTGLLKNQLVSYFAPSSIPHRLTVDRC